jgi:hypothetical protein
MPDKTRLDKCSGTPGLMDSSFNNAMPININTASREKPKLAKMMGLQLRLSGTALPLRTMPSWFAIRPPAEKTCPLLIIRPGAVGGRWVCAAEIAVPGGAERERPPTRRRPSPRG